MKNIEDKNTNRNYLDLLTLMGLFILYLGFVSCNSGKKIVKDNADLLGVNENNSTVAAFINYVDANNKLTPDHSYINNALVKLADATDAMARETGYSIKEDLSVAKIYANKITSAANETSHADNIRKSADILSTALINLQVAKYPTLSTASSELRGASASIDPKVLTNNQRDAIIAFFRRSAYLLEKMN